MADPAGDLYGLPLEEFTAARDAAARELRRSGDREAAAGLAKLPKPTPAAWAANQLARTEPDLIRALLDAGEELREAQAQAVGGGGGAGLREATAAERQAVDAAMVAAAELKPGGRPLSRAMADRLRATLHAAAADDTVREALAAGRLASEAEAGGAWPLGAMTAPAKPRSGRAAGAKRGSAGAEAGAKRRTEGAAAGGRAAGDKGRSEGATAGGRAAAGKGGSEGAATKRRAAGEDREAAAARRAAEREAAERAAEARKALEAELRAARGELRKRDQALKSAERAAERAQKWLADAQRDADAAADAVERAREGLGHARDDVARLEERLD